MITIDLWHIRAGEWLLADLGGMWCWVTEQSRDPVIGAWPREVVDSIIPQLKGPCVDGQTVARTLELATPCECCGKHRYQTNVTLVVDHPNPRRRLYRCDKHMGRIPCIIEGCGRTFASEGYDHIIMCGRHWRQAPRYMRDAVARVRRLGRKRDWPDDILRRHHRLWHRVHRAVRQGQNVDMREIETMFGL